MNQDQYPEDESQFAESERPRRFFSSRIFFLLLMVGFIVPIAYGGWKDLYTNFLETTKPRISVRELPRGIGEAPVDIPFLIEDSGAGLDEVIVRIKQRGQIKEILRKSLEGKPSAEDVLTFPGQESGLEEGSATLEIRAFDKSLWNNGQEAYFELRVDYHKPKIEVLSTQHNSRIGGSQLIFYKALDEELSISGVKSGTEIFYGYPARGLDKDFEDKNLFVAMYAIDLKHNRGATSLKVFADDRVGNGASVTFPHRIMEREQRSTTVNIGDDFLREQLSALYESDYHHLQALSTPSTPLENNLSGSEPLIEKFRLVNENLREMNKVKLGSSLVSRPRFESLWSGFFYRHPGTIVHGFGDKITFMHGGQKLGETVSDGYEIALPRGEKEVYATNDGIVIMSDNLGVYGRMIAIDHGLGLCSIYSHLNNVVVAKGDSVKKGQHIAVLGKTGFSFNNTLYFEMRLAGVPVDPQEWWDASWFNQHITQKINNLKKDLGIPLYVPLGP